MEYNVETLIDKYSNMVLQIAYQNSFNKSDAEDISQEVFIKLAYNLSKLKDDEHIKAWLIKVTINLSRDYNKSFWNRNSMPLNEDLKYFDEETIEVFKSLSKLKPIFRNTIYLYYYQGYKIDEIAKILEMSPNTVSSNLTRARKKLKGLLEADGGEEYVREV